MSKKSKIPSKTRRQIADEFDIHYQTLWRRLEKNGIKLPKGRLLPKWQKVVYEELGYPKSVQRSDYEEV
jgi:hypothetical protein